MEDAVRREQAGSGQDAGAADPAEQAAVEAFITKWQGVPASELSTSQSFLIDLCALLGVDAPHATPEQDYMFERPITFHHGDGSTSAGRIDLYRRGAFVLESKKVRAGVDILAASPVPLSTSEIAARFTGRGTLVGAAPETSGMLVALGSAQEQDGCSPHNHLAEELSNVETAWGCR